MINKRSIKFVYEKKEIDLKPMAIFLSDKFQKGLSEYAEKN